MNSISVKPNRECCKHGIKCYRKNNAVHMMEVSHPGDDDYTIPVYDDTPSDVPACKYAEQCYQRNPEHFRRFSHPPVVPQCELEARQLDQLDTLWNSVTLIENLQPGKEQTIRARVIIKSDKSIFLNTKGNRSMCTMNIIDQTGEIRFTSFGPNVNQISDLIEVNKIYYFSKFTTKHSDPIPGVNQLESRLQLISNESTSIVPDLVNRIDLPHLSFNFETLTNIHLKHKDEVMDFLAICVSCGPMEDLIINSDEGKKRELYLVDQSNKKITLTIWGTNAEKFQDSIPGCVIAVKRAKVTDYAGNLDSSCLSSSTFKVNPDIHEADILRNWYRTKNAVHLMEVSDAVSTMPVYDDPPTGVPSYEEECFQRNPSHFRAVSHPPVGFATSTSWEYFRVRFILRIAEYDQFASVLIQNKYIEHIDCQNDDRFTESLYFVLIIQTLDLEGKKEARQLDQLDPLWDTVTLIKELQPEKEQTIRGRITIKSDKHFYKRGRVMCTMDIIDETGEIRLTSFGPYVDQFFDLVEVGKIYYFSKFIAKLSDLRPGVIHVNRIELRTNGSTSIVPDIVNRIDLPHLSYYFEPLGNVDFKEKYEVMDILAICESYGPMQDVILKKSAEGKKRELYLVDQSNKKITLTIWGTNAEKFQSYTPGCVIAVKRARITDYKGKNLDSSCLSSSTFKIDPDIPEAALLRNWFTLKTNVLKTF